MLEKSVGGPPVRIMMSSHVAMITTDISSIGNLACLRIDTWYTRGYTTDDVLTYGTHVSTQQMTIQHFKLIVSKEHS